jgi:Uma2 family endonuclease
MPDGKPLTLQQTAYMQLAELDVNRLYNYADYFSWKFEERVELIKGKLFPMSPAPNYTHQLTVGRLHVSIGHFLRKKNCQVFVAPFDVRFPKLSGDGTEVTTVLQPDLCVVCDRAKLDEKGCLGAPDLVIEVLSPSNNQRDTNHKYKIYEEYGVHEYWLAFPTEQIIQVFTLKDGSYVAGRPYGVGDSITTPILPGFQLDVSEIFEA